MDNQTVITVTSQASMESIPMEPTVDDPLGLTKGKISEQTLKELSRQGSKGKVLRKHYIRQNELIDNLLTPVGQEDEDKESNEFKLQIAIYGSLFANVCLFALQLTAALLTGSLAILATTADAFMDIASSLVIVAATRAAKKENYVHYPTGRGKYETAGVIVFATLMATLSIQLIVESAKRLSDGEHNLDLSAVSLAMVGTSIGIKFLLYLYCSALSQYTSAKVLAQDHRNDILFNSTGIIATVLAAKVKWWIDPATAILIAVLVIRSWVITGFEHIEMVVGKAAEPEFISKLTYVSLTHDPRVLQVDTCRAYHSGAKMFVEVDIVLPADMPLKEAHDIGEALQVKLEMVEDVERAFVHIDYESSHPIEHRKL